MGIVLALLMTLLLYPGQALAADDAPPEDVNAVKIVRPAPGETQEIQCAAGDSYMFDFPSSEVTLNREGGNLAIIFDDGARVTLKDFYRLYDNGAEFSFMMDDRELSIEEIFAELAAQDEKKDDPAASEQPEFKLQAN